MNNPSFYIGVVEDRQDPKKLGRVKVRVMGLHTFDKTILPTDDLPWAYKIQPTTSGAISGIGSAPVGVIEGTWVAVQYIDPDKQMPFIVGTFGGIPQKVNPGLESFLVEPTDKEPIPSNVLTTSDGTVVNDGSGQPITTGEPVAQTNNDPEWKAKVTKRLGELESSNNYKAVNSLNYLGKYQFGAAALTDRGYVKKGTKNRELDNPEVWTGKDSIVSKDAFLNNPNVQEKVMSQNIDANYRTMKRIGIPLDTMTDADKAGYVAASHLYGAGGAKNLYNGVVKADANGTTTRKYFEEGYKTVAGSTPESPPQQTRTPKPDEVARQNKDAIKNPSTPATGEQKEGYRNRIIDFRSDEVGFKDPAQRYPLETHLNEPDTNRLARHEKIGETIVFTKEFNRHVGVEKANDKGTWDQSATPYNAKYPFNNVYQSESGHLLEFDDTDGRERIHLYHAKGTFTEVDHNGTQVNFIVGDNFTIMERNGFVHVVGSLDVKVDGAHTLFVEGNTDVQINGNATVNIHSNAALRVAGDLDISAGGRIFMKSGSHIALDAPKIDLNSGPAEGLSIISSIGASTSSAAALNVLTRGEEIAVNYEVDPENAVEYERFKTIALQEGILTEEQLEAEPVVEDKKVAPENKVKEIPVEPVIKNKFDCNEKISKYYTLGDLTSNCTRKIQDQSGLTANDIYNNLKAIAVNVLDPLREKYPNMKINSALRLGNEQSQHNKGQAVDISFPGLSRSDLYNRIQEVQQMVPYDQMILEYLTPGGNGWIHISYKQNNLRRQVFSMNNHKRVGPIGTFTRIA